MILWIAAWIFKAVLVAYAVWILCCVWGWLKENERMALPPQVPSIPRPPGGPGPGCPGGG